MEGHLGEKTKKHMLGPLWKSAQLLTCGFPLTVKNLRWSIGKYRAFLSLSFSALAHRFLLG